jgi:hypothetical protein
VAGLSVGRAAQDEANKTHPNKQPHPQAPPFWRGYNPTSTGGVRGNKHDCAGMSHGPTVKEHVCKGHNDCAGTGGCGEKPGENECKGMGNCAVPLKDTAWKRARANFEAAMKKAEKKFGDAPEKAE